MIAMNKKYIKILGLAAIAIGGYLVIRNFLKAKNSTQSQEPQTPSTLPESNSKGEYPIKKGSKGSGVKKIQDILLQIDANALPKYGADGDFGKETEAALFKYLKKLSVDSFIDIQSLQAIADAKTQQNVDDTRQVMAKNIIDDWKNGRIKTIKAKDMLEYAVGNITIDGREINLSKKGVFGGNTIVNGFEIQDMSVLPSGFLKIVTTGNGLTKGFIKVSPFGIVTN